LSGTITEVAKYQKGWTGGLPETRCGYGSKIDQTEAQRGWIPRMVEKYEIHSIADVGAGDLNWIKLVEWPHPVDYRAYDLVPLADNVTKFDLIHEVPPQSDLIMCLWLLNHLPEHHARVALDNLRASGAKWLMYTWWSAMADFLDLGFIDSAVMRTNSKNMRFEIRLVECGSL